MPDGIQPKTLELLQPGQFQRLALDLLRAHAAERDLEIRALDLGYGRTDGGWDGRWIRREGEKDWRIEVKATGSWSSLKSEISDHLEKYDDRPTLVVCRLPLTEDQRDELKELREEPSVDVVDGSEIAGFLRDYHSIARVWGFGPPVELETTEKFSHRRQGRVPLQSEVHAAESVLTNMGDAASLVLVDGAESSRPHAVLEEIARQLAERGDPSDHVAFVATGTDLRDLSEAKLRAMFARPAPERTRVVLIDPDEALVGRLVDLGISVVTGRRGGVRNLKKLGERASVSTTTVELPKPSAADLRRLLEEVSGRKGIEIDHLALQWGDPDLLQMALEDPQALEAEFWTRARDSEGRQLCAWVGLLGEATIEQLMSVARMDRQSTERIIEDLRKAGLLQTRKTTVLPEVPASRPLLVRTWTEDDNCDPSRLTAATMGLEPTDRTAVLEGLFAASPPGGDCTAAKIAHDVLKATEQEGRLAILRTNPLVFAISETWYRWALEHAPAAELRSGPALALVEASRWQQSLAPDAMDYLIGVAPPHAKRHDVERRIRGAFHPGALRAAAVARALDRLAQRIETEPTTCDPEVVKAVTAAWLAGDVQLEQAFLSGIQFQRRGWNTDSLDVRDAFAAAARVALACATSSERALRDAGWLLLIAAGDGTAVTSPPVELGRVVVDAVVDASKNLVQVDRVERMLRQEQLRRKTWQEWTHEEDLPSKVSEALAEDEASMLIRRLTTLYDLKEGVRGPPRSWEDMEPVDRSHLVERDEVAVRDWLATNPSHEDLLQVLLDAGELLAMPQGRHLLRGQVTGHLTQLKPDLVESVLFGDVWDALPREAKTTLLDAARVHYGEELGASVQGWSGWRPGLSSAIRRFLAAPGLCTPEDSRDLTWLLRKVVPDDLAPVIIARLANETGPSARQLLEWWCLEIYERGSSEPAQVRQALAALVAPPNGLRTLGEFGMRLRRGRIPNADPGGPIEGLLLDALEAHAEYAAANEAHDGPADLYLGEGLIPFVDRLLERPAVWWKVAAHLPSGAHHRDGKLFANLNVDETVRILRGGPASHQPPIREARILDAGIQNLGLESFTRAVDDLVESGDLERAGAWLISRGLDEVTIDAFIAVVRQLDDPDVECFALQVGSPCGLKGYGSGRVYASRPFDEPETLEQPPIVGVLLERALDESLDSAVRRALSLVAKCITEDIEVQNQILRSDWDD